MFALESTETGRLLTVAVNGDAPRAVCTIAPGEDLHWFVCPFQGNTVRIVTGVRACVRAFVWL